MSEPPNGTKCLVGAKHEEQIQGLTRLINYLVVVLIAVIGGLVLNYVGLSNQITRVEAMVDQHLKAWPKAPPATYPHYYQYEDGVRGPSPRTGK